MVGDLHRDDAKTFWENLLVAHERTGNNISLPKFDDVFEVCGRSIFLMQAAFQYWDTAWILGQKGDWYSFPCVA